MYFKIKDFWFSDIINFVGRASNLDWKHKKLQRPKIFNPRMVHLTRQTAKHRTSAFEAFYGLLPCCNPLESTYKDYPNVKKCGITRDQAVNKLKLKKPTPTRTEIYQYLQQVWLREEVGSFKVFWRWYNEKAACYQRQILHLGFL